MNPTLKKLGFDQKDRVVIIHADDIGMCQASLPAVETLFELGLLSSAAVMVPCPWFRGAVDLARLHPQWDFGVHLTLNSEWDLYRWGPVSTRRPESGFLDAYGHFFNDTKRTQERADLHALKKELDAQIALAKQAGLEPTHTDTHMFCLGHPRFFETYTSTSLQAGTLPVLLRPGGDAWRYFDFPETGALAEISQGLIENGVPAVDGIYMMNLDTHVDRLEEAKTAFSELKPGITHFILHPTIDTPEIRAMAPDWRCRVADFETFRSPVLLDFVKNRGIQIIGYRALKDLIQADSVVLKDAP